MKVLTYHDYPLLPKDATAGERLMRIWERNQKRYGACSRFFEDPQGFVDWANELRLAIASEVR